MPPPLPVFHAPPPSPQSPLSHSPSPPSTPAIPLPAPPSPELALPSSPPVSVHLPLSPVLSDPAQLGYLPPPPSTPPLLPTPFPLTPSPQLPPLLSPSSPSTPAIPPPPSPSPEPSYHYFISPPPAPLPLPLSPSPPDPAQVGYQPSSPATPPPLPMPLPPPPSPQSPPSLFPSSPSTPAIPPPTAPSPEPTLFSLPPVLPPIISSPPGSPQRGSQPPPLQRGPDSTQTSEGQMNVGDSRAFIEDLGLGADGFLVRERGARKLLQVSKAQSFANLLLERALANSQLATKCELRFRASSDQDVTYTIKLSYPDTVEVDDINADAERMRAEMSKELNGDSIANQALAASYQQNVAGTENYGGPQSIAEANLSKGLTRVLPEDLDPNGKEVEEKHSGYSATELVLAIVLPIVVFFLAVSIFFFCWLRTKFSGHPRARYAGPAEVRVEVIY
ncbi:hypothetical protein DUNSADRAFT_4102, partial [Dunaliella salina]